MDLQPRMTSTLNHHTNFSDVFATSTNWPSPEMHIQMSREARKIKAILQLAQAGKTHTIIHLSQSHTSLMHHSLKQSQLETITHFMNKSPLEVTPSTSFNSSNINYAIYRINSHTNNIASASQSGTRAMQHARHFFDQHTRDCPQTLKNSRP